MSENLGHIKSQELLVVLEHLIYEKTYQRVLINVSQKDIKVIMDLDLVLKVAFDIAHQKVVALVNQLLVEWVVHTRLVHSVFYEEHR